MPISNFTSIITSSWCHQVVFQVNNMWLIERSLCASMLLRQSYTIMNKKGDQGSRWALDTLILPLGLPFFFYKKHVYSYNKKEQPKGKAQEGPSQKKLRNDGLPIVENHWKAIITKVFGVIRAPPRSCVLQHSPKRINRIIAIFKNSTIPFFPNAPQKGPSRTFP